MRTALKSLAYAAGVALITVGLFPMAIAQDQAGSGGLTFDYYGHINIGIQRLNDGVNNDAFVTDNDNSNSRVGFNLRKELDNGDKLRFQFETALGLTGSGSTTPLNNGFELTTRRTELRRFDLSYSSDSFGTFWAGQGGTATDGVAENDLSGTSVVAYSGLADLGGSVAFRTTAGAQSAVTVGSAFANFDGSRRFRVRYDTPSLAGATLAVSYGQEILRSGDTNDYVDAALIYGRDYGDFIVNSAVGYSDRDNGREFAMGSLAVRHTTTGLNAAFATGENLKGNGRYVFAKAGVVQDWLGIGDTAVSFEYYGGSDFVSIGSDSTSYGVSAVQKVDAYNLELYASYRTFEFTDTTSTYQDVNAAILGARFKF